MEDQSEAVLPYFKQITSVSYHLNRSFETLIITIRLEK